MLGWFRPLCPCDPAAKQWIEERLQWLTGQFGLHLWLERPVILPREEFFPDPWDGSKKAVRRMFRRVCGYMGVNPDEMNLELFDDPTPRSVHAIDPTLGFAAGTWTEKEDIWKKNRVRIERGGTDRPSDMVGTMAHELAHQKLLGEDRFRADTFDNELLTDLTAVFHGFGIFLANNPRKSTGKLSHWPGTKLYKPEYISEPMLGYALAHLAWHRDEPKPSWAKHLKWAMRAVLKQGLRFLSSTADSTFKPVRLLGSRAIDD